MKFLKEKIGLKNLALIVSVLGLAMGLIADQIEGEAEMAEIDELIDVKVQNKLAAMNLEKTE